MAEVNRRFKNLSAFCCVLQVLAVRVRLLGQKAGTRYYEQGKQQYGYGTVHHQSKIIISGNLTSCARKIPSWVFKRGNRSFFEFSDVNLLKIVLLYLNMTGAVLFKRSICNRQCR